MKLHGRRLRLYAKVYSREQMTIMREDYSPYPDTIVLRGAAAGSDGTAVDGQYLDRKI